MFISIEKTNNIVHEDFIKFITRVIRRLVISMCSKSITQSMELELDRLGVNHSALELILDCLSSLKYKEFENYFCIYIAENKYMDGEALSTLSICRLIDRGNLAVRGSNLFTMVFNHIKENLQRYFDMYCFIPH